jgi:hypothetical protein
MEFIEWEPTAKGNVHVLNDTADLYRYFDCTLKDEELIELEEIVRDAFDGFDLALGANLHSESEK